MSGYKVFIPSIIVFAVIVMIILNLLVQDNSNTPNYSPLHATLDGLHDYREFINRSASILSQTFQVRDSPSEYVPDVVKPKKKIAYIFAGSARSFVCNKVHWSIRSHLIDAFGDDPYVFVRISIDDNKNIKTGHGTMWTPTYKENEINETLKILNPRTIKYFSFANQLEEMEENYPGLDHAVFRQNDRRRYSMFFHRCMSYKLMLQYEKEHNIQFDWVVLVRLDAAWMEPVLPISSYNSDRVWITETGFDLFNDQFMLIPRQFSDYIYDLNTKVHQDVYCLGGPDVEKWKCKRDEQLKRGISGPLLDKTMERCCNDIFTQDRRGASERIHFRHLRHGKIPVSTARFPVALVRRRPDTTCFIECFRLYTYQYKEYLFRFNGSLYPYFKSPEWPDTRGRTISARDKVACVMMDSGVHFNWQPISALELHTTFAGSYNVDYSSNLYDQTEKLHPSILMQPKDLEAWRIHPTFNVDGCLTFSYSHRNLSWSRCNAHVIPHQMRYDQRQLFFLQVIPESPSEFDFRTRPQTQLLPLGKPLVARKFTRIVVMDGNNRDWEPRQPVQCLTAIRKESGGWKGAVVTSRDCSENLQLKSQLFHAVKGWTSGSIPFSTVGSMRLAADPRYCVTRLDDADRDNAVVPSGDLLQLDVCEPGGHMHQVLFEFELIFS